MRVNLNIPRVVGSSIACIWLYMYFTIYIMYHHVVWHKSFVPQYTSNRFLSDSSDSTVYHSSAILSSWSPEKKKSGRALDRLMKMSVMPWSKSTKLPTPGRQKAADSAAWNITWGHGGFIFHMDFRACVVLRSSISWCHDLSFFKIWTRITYKQYETIYNWLYNTNLVGGFKPSEKYEFVSQDDDIPNMMGKS